MIRVDLSHTEGNEQVAPNQFCKISAGYPLQIDGQWWLVLNIVPSVKVRPSDNSDDLIIAYMFVLKLTNSGAYSKAQSHYGTFFIRMSGIVEQFRDKGNIWKSRLTLDGYNQNVREGRKTQFVRNRYFERGNQEGIEAEYKIEASKTWDGWYNG